MASNGKAVTGTAVMARSANEEKKKNKNVGPLRTFLWICIGETWGVFTLGDTRKY